MKKIKYLIITFLVLLSLGFVTSCNETEDNNNPPSGDNVPEQPEKPAEEITKEYHPFDIDSGDEVAEVVNFAQFIAYKYGNEISHNLEAEYQREELRRKEEESKKITEQIRRLKKR